MNGIKNRIEELKFQKEIRINQDNQRRTTSVVLLSIVFVCLQYELSDNIDIDIHGDSSLYNCPRVQYDTSSGVYYYRSNGQDDGADDEIDAEIHFEIGVTS